MARPLETAFDAPRSLGRCEIFGAIARGGMATVYLGRWLGEARFRKVVAIKALHPELGRDPEFSSMFLDEARVVARIRHPNVLPTLDVVAEGDELFIVMELLEGATLAALVAESVERQRPIPAAIAKRILVGVLEGLHAAHEARDERGEPLEVIHRDVAPDNIMVGIDGYARVIDFGIARAAGRHTHTRTGMIKGKIAYLAPEQLLEEPLSRRTDVYGASVVGWQMLTGRRLFEGDSAGELVMNIIRQSIPPPGKLGGDGTLDPIIMRGLCRDPEARWPTAEAMAEAIEATGELATPREVGQWVRELVPDKLAQLRRLVERIERHPVTAPVSARRLQRSAVELEPLTHPGEVETARTDVTSEADSPQPVRTSLLHHAAIAAIVAGGIAGTLWLRPPPDPPAAATIVVTAPPPPPPVEPAPGPSAIEENGAKPAPKDPSDEDVQDDPSKEVPPPAKKPAWAPPPRRSTPARPPIRFPDDI